MQISRNHLTEEFLDELTARLRDAANGQLRELAIDGTSTAVLVFCRTETYYGLQLVMSALERAGDALTQGLVVRLSAEVKGAFFRISFGGESAPTMPGDGWTPWPSRWRKGG